MRARPSDGQTTFRRLGMAGLHMGVAEAVPWAIELSMLTPVTESLATFGGSSSPSRSSE
jgi:hypothetical protein